MVYDACSGWTTIVIPALQGTIPVIAARILPKTGHSWSSLSSCYISRVTLRLSTLRDSQQNTDPQSSILDFEKETVAIDSAIKGKVEGMCVCMYMWLSTKQSLFIHYRKQLEEYWTHGHPYLRGFSITGSQTWVPVHEPPHVTGTTRIWVHWSWHHISCLCRADLPF